MRRAALLLTLIAAIVSAAVPSGRQSPATAPANTIWVTVNVTHTDGHLVPDLTAADFEVTDNGQRREITVFRNDPIPIAVAIMIDVSSSMETNYGLVRRAVTSLISSFQPGDRAIIGSFDALPWIGNRFSARPEALQQSLSAALSVSARGGTLALCDGDWIDKVSTRGTSNSGYGIVLEFSRRLKMHAGSAIWDGAACGINAVASDGETPRRILVLMTDALDNLSSTKVPHVIDRANRAGVMVYSIAMMGGYGMAGGDLKSLATATGGGYFYLTGEDKVADAFTRIGNELRHQYVFGVAASGSVTGSHDIVVTSRAPNTTVRSRRVFMDAPANTQPLTAGRMPPPIAAAPPVPQTLTLRPADAEPRAPEPPSPLPTGAAGRSLAWQRLDEMLDPSFELGHQPRLKIGELRALIGLLKKDAPAWIRLVPPPDQGRRRLAAAMFALDLLYTQNDPYLWTQNQPAPDIIDWAAGVLDDGPPTPEEKLWSFGAIALFERGGVPLPLERFLVRAEKRFPGEERWTLARAVAEDLRTWPDERDVRAFRVDPLIAGPLVSRYDAAILLPSVKQEALLRLGYFELRRGRTEEAIAHLGAAASTETSDEIMRFWLHLLYGRALEQSGRVEEAIAQFQSALDAVPGATSATSALIAALSKAHRPAEAARVAANALATPAAVLDPWTIYVLPDFRFWPSITEQLRLAVLR